MADYGEMMDSGARSAKRTILIPKCSNEEEDDRMEIFCLLFRRYLPKNNQRRREKTHVEESRSSHISGTDVLTLRSEGEIDRKVSESRQDDERGEL